MMPNSVIINFKYSGLGDNLFYTPLPRLLKELGVQKVYVSNDVGYRSGEIRRLLWELNPYVDGFADGGHTVSVVYGLKGNLLADIAAAYGIDDVDYLTPEVYYRPELKKKFEGRIGVDMNYKSFVGSVSKKEVLCSLGLVRDKILINPPEWLAGMAESYWTSSLQEYFDVVSSCAGFYCFTSGGATLADAFGVRAHCYYGYGQNDIFHHSRLHSYFDVSYRSLFVNVVVSASLRVMNKIARYVSR